MAALNFPTSPIDKQEFNNWVYSASKGAWKAMPLLPPKTYTSDTPPASPANGEQWLNTVDGALYIYVTDVDSSQWVEVKNPGNYAGDALTAASLLLLGGRVTVVESLDLPQTANIIALQSVVNPMKGYRYIRNTDMQTDTTGRTFGTGWTTMWTATNTTGYLAGSHLLLEYHLPLRNDLDAWSGAYIEPQITYNNSTWYSLGSSGYDGGIMSNGAGVIGSYNNSIYINPSLDGVSGNFSVCIRFVCKAYAGTVSWNQSHDINASSGTASTGGVANRNQHYASFSIIEMAII
jgi:hypothetical protein